MHGDAALFFGSGKGTRGDCPVQKAVPNVNASSAASMLDVDGALTRRSPRAAYDNMVPAGVAETGKVGRERENSTMPALLPIILTVSRCSRCRYGAEVPCRAYLPPSAAQGELLQRASVMKRPRDWQLES